jgi:carbon monoxide dehydrogenase subunit G
MISLAGDKVFALSPLDLTAKLSDPAFLVQCIPDLESVAQLEAQRAVVTVRPGFAFIRGTLEVNLQVANVQPGQVVDFIVRGKGIGSSNTVAIQLAISSQDGGSQVHWTADVQELGGLLKAVPRGLIQATAQKVIEDVWRAAEARLNAA